MQGILFPILYDDDNFFKEEKQNMAFLKLLAFLKLFTKQITLNLPFCNTISKMKSNEQAVLFPIRIKCFIYLCIIS